MKEGLAGRGDRCGPRTKAKPRQDAPPRRRRMTSSGRRRPSRRAAHWGWAVPKRTRNRRSGRACSGRSQGSCPAHHRCEPRGQCRSAWTPCGKIFSASAVFELRPPCWLPRPAGSVPGCSASGGNLRPAWHRRRSGTRHGAPRELDGSVNAPGAALPIIENGQADACRSSPVGKTAWPRPSVTSAAPLEFVKVGSIPPGAGEPRSLGELGERSGYRALLLDR